jgi:hypothetical protein
MSYHFAVSSAVMGSALILGASAIWDIRNSPPVRRCNRVGHSASGLTRLARSNVHRNQGTFPTHMSYSRARRKQSSTK